MLYSFDEILNTINDKVDNIKFTQEPQTLFSPIEYILGLGGKRVRPALALMSCNLFKDNIDDVIPIALGIEVFHNFTLLHDDLMDRADVRRGQPTVHKKWSDNIAILSGDAMLIEAYKFVAQTKSDRLSEVMSLFSQTATEICCGQQFDMEFESRLDVTIDEYIEMIRLKTAVLLGCALKEGAIIGNANDADADHLYDFGISIGLAFQLKDDLLDVYGDPETFGKKIGGDILCNKKTFLLINALQSDDTKEELLSWINKTTYDEIEKIEAVTAIYNKLNLKAISENLIRDYLEKGITSLNKVSISTERKHVLSKLAEDLMFRNS